MATPSSRPDMGAIPYDTGVTFRVWAPNADGVSVAGQFNQWDAHADALGREAGGYWSGDVEGARAGQQYRFVVFRAGQEPLWKIDPYAREVTSSSGNAIVTDTGFDWGPGEFSAPAWHEMVVYQMHIGTFLDDPGGKPGVFDAVITRLPYLRDLGVNTIKVLPSAEFPGDYSWGYNATNIFSVESSYGGPNALKRFVRAAHEHGLAVILDVVYNHFGPGHDLGQSVWRFDGWHLDDWGGVYFYNDWRADTPWGTKNRPDYGRPEVRQYLRDNMMTWMEEFRLDGLRFDATSYIRRVYGDREDLADGWNLLRWLNDELQARQAWKITICEDMRNDAWLTRETSQGGAGFDAQWDSEFVHRVREVLRAFSDGERDVGKIERALYHRYGTNALERVVYTESHDEVARTNAKRRLPVDIDQTNPGSKFARKRSTLGAALVFTAPGIPMIFQGQEFHEDREFHDDLPIDWRKAEWFAGILALYRDLIRLRRNWYDHTRGLRGQHVNVHHADNETKVVAFHRWDGGGPGDDVLVVLNFANRAWPGYTVGAPSGGLWRVRFNSDSRIYSPDFDDHPSFDAHAAPSAYDGLSHRIELSLGAYTALILSQ
ncbi:MAG: alpha-amylase family glycosyl hydrolase [Pyrinomonadaceae bacterium]